MNEQDPLAQLKDIQSPEAVSWWPPAWGWWLLLILVLLGLGLLCWRGYRRWRSQRYRRQALARLREIEARYRAADPGPQANREFVQAINELLRRTALSALPEPGASEVAALRGRQWLALLERSAPMAGGFTDGAGQILAEGPYQPEPEPQAEALCQLAERWIQRHRLSTSTLPELLAEVRRA